MLFLFFSLGLPILTEKVRIVGLSALNLPEKKREGFQTIASIPKPS